MAENDKSNSDMQNKDEQKNPVMEVIPDEPEKSGPGSPEPFIPEEIPEETPEDLTLKDIAGSPPGGSPPIIEDSDFSDGSDKKKYIFAAVGIVGVIIVFVTIFSLIMRLVGGGSSSDPVVLEYWGLWEDEAVMQTVIEDYQRENGNVTITYVKQEPQQYREKLLARSEEGRGPDIFRYHNTWLPSIITIASSIPSSVMSNDDFESTFYEVAQEDLFNNGSYYGIPLGIDGLVLVYNKDLFQRAGIQGTPRSWDEIVPAADALRVQDPDNNIITAGIALGTATNIEHFSDIFAWMLLQNGASLDDLNSDQAVAVLANYRGFSEPQLNLWNESMPSDINAFLQSKVGMIIVPSWEILSLLEANPDLEIGVAPLPILPGTSQVSLATYWVEGVNKTSRNQEEAWKFLAYLSEREVMTKLYEEQAKVRPFGVPYSRVDLRDELIDHEFIGPVLDQAPSMQSMPMVTRTYDNGLNDSIVGYIEDAITSAQNGVSYSQAMSKAHSGVQAELEKYNIE